MHDGSQLFLRKVAEDYNPSDKLAATRLLHETARRGEFAHRHSLHRAGQGRFRRPPQPGRRAARVPADRAHAAAEGGARPNHGRTQIEVGSGFAWRHRAKPDPLVADWLKAWPQSGTFEGRCASAHRPFHVHLPAPCRWHLLDSNTSFRCLHALSPRTWTPACMQAIRSAPRNSVDRS